MSASRMQGAEERCRGRRRAIAGGRDGSPEPGKVRWRGIRDAMAPSGLIGVLSVARGETRVSRQTGSRVRTGQAKTFLAYDTS